MRLAGRLNSTRRGSQLTYRMKWRKRFCVADENCVAYTLNTPYHATATPVFNDVSKTLSIVASICDGLKTLDLQAVM